MIKHLFAFLLVFPVVVFAQDIKCPKGYQPYANRCVSQGMADYISCVEASGGNREQIFEEVSEIGGKKVSTDIKASGSGTIVKGSGSLLVDQASEKTLAKRWETRWFPKGMSECSKVLDRATTRNIKRANQEATAQTSGVLFPDNKAMTSDHPCKDMVSKDDFILLLGNSASFSNTFPYIVILVGDQPMLTIDRKGNKISISGKFFSRDGRIVAELKENRFYVNPNNYFRIESPNRHVLVVYDQQGNQALNLHYLNASTVKLLGRFYFPNRPPIIINEEFLSIGGLELSDSCMGRAKSASIHLE